MHNFNPPTVRVVAYYSLDCNIGCDEQFLLIGHRAQVYGIK